MAANAARAVPARPQDAAEQALPLQLEVFLNGRPTGMIAAFTRSADGKISARRAELADVGIRAAGEGGPDSVVELDGAPGISYRYDEQKQTIRIEASEDLIIGKEYPVLRGAMDAPKPRSGLGAVVNYDLFTSTLTRLSSFRPSYQGASATLDARFFSPYGTLSQSAVLGSTLVRPAHALRLDTSFGYSDPDSLITYKAGDAISSGLAWTRPIRMAGAQIQRNFGLRPDLVTLPLPVLSGTAAVPSTLDVYVDNVRTYSQEVQAGPYRITDLPLTGGGSARVVLRDSAGHQIEKDMQFFASRQLMRKGFTDFSAEVGVARRSYGVSSFDYSRAPVANASLRHGVHDWLTVEGHVEGAQKLANVGVGAVARVLDRAIVGAAVSGSRSPFGYGLQAYGSFETRFKDITINLTSQRTFGRYNDLASVTSSVTAGALGATVAAGAGLSSFAFLTSILPLRELDRLSVGVPLYFDKSLIGASVTRLVNADSRKSFIASVNWSRNIFWDASIFLSAYTNIGARRELGLFAGVAIPLGPKTVASTGLTSRGGGRFVVSSDASRVLDFEEGSYGWRIHDTEGAQGNALRSAAASYRSRWARLEAGVSQQGTSATGTLEASGAVATLGNGVFLSNRIDDAFAVVETGGPDVPVYHENRLIGRTDSNGRLLVPYLRSYQRNRLKIDPVNLPVNASIASTEEVVVPAHRNGLRVDFGVKPAVAGAVVVLVGPDGKFLPVGSQGRLEGTGEKFVVGYDGRAYVTGLGASNTARVSLGLGECRASFDYAPSQDRQVVIGPAPCL